MDGACCMASLQQLECNRNSNMGMHSSNGEGPSCCWRIHGLLHHTMALRPDASGLPFFAQKGLPFFKQKGTLSVPTFLSPHVSQFPRFHMSGQTTWQITYESLLGKMLRLRNSCLWICSVTNKQTWGTPDSDYISNSQERKSHTENKQTKKKMADPPLYLSQDGL